MSNFFQIAENFEQHGNAYIAKLFVDNDRKEAFLSVSLNGRLFAVNFPVRYGVVFDPRRARKALKSSGHGWSLLSSLARAALLERPFDVVEALEDFKLSGV